MKGGSGESPLSSHDGKTRKGEEKGKVAMVVLGLEVTVVVDGVDASRHRRAGGRSLSIVVVGGVDVGRRKLSLTYATHGIPLQ
jgi:hypothetical protein